MSQMHYDDKGRMTTEDIAAAKEKGQEKTGSAEQAGATFGTDEQERGEQRAVFPGEATGRPSGEGPEDVPASGGPQPQQGTGRTDEGAGSTNAGTGTGPSDKSGHDGRADEDGNPDREDDGRDDREPLLPAAEAQELRVRWQQVQTDFVDDPRAAVHTADALVADLMQRLAESFADRRRNLESQWNRGDTVETEELRVALQQYRTFFNRLLQS
ncbi:hypothetical protein P3T27_003386 [Kitasatospora sp. MAA19]|uniref:hypothetical protein n=1 Tax=Kitasatospora sp. MAA19 TaxID=3035090 RepID=UPI002475D2EF|nr:hypothetical protein [Kitasatospora sp. MAA19]MDH6706659.1 hypothetical protein [Kitasatospora sp. MAA19]